MPEIAMPRLSDSMEEGTIIRWLKRDGDSVERGEPLVEIETDKATMDFEAPQAGVLRIVVGEGESVPVGAPIATVGDGAVAVAAPPAAEPKAAPIEAPHPPAPRRAGREGKASPLARRLAADLGIDVATIAGSGPGGRVLKADVRSAATQQSAAPEPAVGNALAPLITGPRGPVESVELNKVQSVVARRMSSSKATAPDFSLDVEADMSAVLALREQLRAQEVAAPSVNDFVVRATAVTLRHHPRANGSFDREGFQLWSRINIGVAVAAEDALLVPTIFDADRLPLSEISRETRRLAERGREGKLLPQELDGGTFTISNLGMFGIDRFAGIVNEPQAAILCVGRLAERPIVVEGEVVARPTMRMTLVSDHRILYGADAARFLADLVKALENPLATLI